MNNSTITYKDIEEQILSETHNYEDMGSDVYTSRDAETQRLKAYALGITDGYKHKSENTDRKIKENCIAYYTDGLMVGMGIETLQEFKVIIDKVDKRLKTRRLTLKHQIVGAAYGMNR